VFWSNPTWTSQNQKEKLAHKIGTLTKLKIKIYLIFVWVLFLCPKSFCSLGKNLTF